MTKQNEKNVKIKDLRLLFITSSDLKINIREANGSYKHLLATTIGHSWQYKYGDINVVDLNIKHLVIMSDDLLDVYVDAKYLQNGISPSTDYLRFAKSLNFAPTIKHYEEWESSSLPLSKWKRFRRERKIRMVKKESSSEKGDCWEVQIKTKSDIEKSRQIIVQILANNSLPSTMSNDSWNVNHYWNIVFKPLKMGELQKILFIYLYLLDRFERAGNWTTAMNFVLKEYNQNDDEKYKMFYLLDNLTRFLEIELGYGPREDALDD